MIRKPPLAKAQAALGKQKVRSVERRYLSQFINFMKLASPRKISLKWGYFSTGRVPAEWKKGIIVSLYKGKGPQSECSSYRPISLLSVSGKVFAHILLAHIQPLLVKCRRPQQSGFTTGRSTMDAILALRLLAELHTKL